MNLANFLTRSIENNTINEIINGYENSQFSQDIPDCGIIVKELFDKLNNYQSPFNDITSVNGALSAASFKPQHKTNNSFSMEFHSMCSNILALSGYELSYNLTVIMSLRILMNDYIDHIMECENYKEILSDILTLRNLYSHKEFKINKFDSVFAKSDLETNVFRMNQEIIPFGDTFFNNIILSVKNAIKKNGISSFENNKNIYYKALSDLRNNTAIEKYDINNIDDLVHNIGDKIAYKKWFIKQWEMLYLELSVNADMSLSQDIRFTFKGNSIKDIQMDNSPLNNLFSNLGMLQAKDKYITNFIVYFNQIITETRNGILNEIGDDIIDVEITPEFLEYFAEIMLNLFAQIALNLYDFQQYSILNKSSRIHYALLYYLVTTIKPRLVNYDKTQLSVLRYILLPKKSIEESINILNEKNGIKTKQPKKATSTEGKRKYTKRK